MGCFLTFWSENCILKYTLKYNLFFLLIGCTKPFIVVVLSFKIDPLKDDLAKKWPLIKIHNDNTIRILSLCIHKKGCWLLVVRSYKSGC
jgi:hypothetical protein